MNRAAGILLPITSLPSKYGIGCFSQSAYDFVDWLKEAGQCYWQILPLVPTSFGDSPYQSFSTYAGNPYFISLEALVEEGVLTEKECEKADFGKDPKDIDYEKMYKSRYPLLRKAYERSNVSENQEYLGFVEKNSWWLKDYALFMAVKERFGGKPWTQWAEDIRLRWGNALDYYRKEQYFEIEFHQYLQFQFYKQWLKLKAYANEKGVKIIGDIPIYVAMDSADAWAHPELFQLDKDNVPVLPGVRGTDFPLRASCGAILSTAGITTGIPDINGGWSGWITVFGCTTWCGSTISAGLTSIIPFPTGPRRLLWENGRRGRGSVCLTA